jgi:hypothetical protein
VIENINLNIKKLYTPVYRIIEFDRIIEILESGQNCFSRPSNWDDPFESLLSFVDIQRSDNYYNRPINDFGLYVYAQCRTFLEENDLLWRVYSPNKDGVRIKSTPSKLIDSLKNSLVVRSIQAQPQVLEIFYSPSGDEKEPVYEEIKAFFGEVEYLSFDAISEYLKSINKDSEFSDLVKSILIKREPFKNEEEVRVGIYHLNDLDPISLFYGEKRFYYDFNINEIFDEVVFDPRITTQKFNGLKDLIINLGYKNKISRSTIYDRPNS